MGTRNSIRRIVVKVGTSTLIHDNGKPNLRRINQLVETLVDLSNYGVECILVSSGAIGIGMSHLRLTHRGKTLSEKQALAAVGQGLLMHIYERKFSEFGATAAQILLTRDDLSDRRRFLNARNTIHELLKLDVVPVINENDTVSVDEIRFGDNDSLAALVAILIDADLTILLTDVDGLYTDNPSLNPAAEKIERVPEITAELEKIAGTAGSYVGTGGMKTKIEAARIATSAGIPLVIASGKTPKIVYDIVHGKSVGTYFDAQPVTPHSRKSWIIYGARALGAVVVDEGAVSAIVDRGKSLLPAGILAVQGTFDQGDMVDIVSSHGKIIAKGISNYAASDIERIKGLQTSQVDKVLDGHSYDVVIHRDNMGLTH